MKLKIKAKIYQYTGVFLAEKEFNEYLQSDQYLEDFYRLELHYNNDDLDPLSFKDLQGILIGTWELDNGFFRPFPMGLLKPWYLKPFYWFKDFYNQLKKDLM